MFYLNPPSVDFLQNRRTPIYVDKSLIIAELNKLVYTNDNFLCVSRPRRFGKSMAGNMIAAYYSKGAGNAEDFAGLKIASDPSFDQWRGKLNVIKFDLNGFLKKSPDRPNLIKTINSFIVEEMKQAFDVDLSGCETIAVAMERVYAATGELFAVIIDEYDVLVREEGISPDLLNDYLSFLSSLFKNADLRRAIAFAYLTGIMPVLRDQIQSKMNEFSEYSMLDSAQFAEYVGFSRAEVRELCVQNNMDYEECSRWYDGYHLREGVDVFSPKSVVEAILRRRFMSYWNFTGSFEALRNYIEIDFGNIREDVSVMIGGGRVDVDVSGFQNNFHAIESKDDVFTYLIHLGYLAYDADTEQCYIPNEEVRKEWVNSLKRSRNERYSRIMERINDSKNLMERTLAMDETYVADSLNKSHAEIGNPLIYNKEYVLQCAIRLAYFYANTRYTVVQEFPSGLGFADVVFIPYVPNVPAMIVELKMNHSPEDAIQQIKDRNYASRLNLYRGDLLLVGLSYDEKTKEHKCKIEKLKV